ncbi:MAG: iron(III) ABC transporter ATP-binding protein [Cyclobacteriaceae bacterium]|nr:MAG: iron(III) ABC transporter ATP-binding protein [Cyclobacteriaceae bacterium]
MENPTVLELKNLTIGFAGGSKPLEILSKVNVRAQQGQLIALIGANGAGKSTLIRSLCGLQPILNGGVWLHGVPAGRLTAGELATKLSVVLTDKIQAGYLTVGDLVATGRHPYTDWRGRLQETDLNATKEALKITGLSSLKQEYLHTLSDGQLQKAMIARALAQDGALMLLDEPLIHLDIPSKWEIMGLLKQMTKKKQKTIVLATHELDLSLQIADRIWLINKYQQLLDETPQEMVQNGHISAAFDTEYYQFQPGSFNRHDK